MKKENPQPWRREKLKILDFWWEWADSGKSFEELAIMVDLHAAGGRISDQDREISHAFERQGLSANC